MNTSIRTCEVGLTVVQIVAGVCQIKTKPLFGWMMLSSGIVASIGLVDSLLKKETQSPTRVSTDLGNVALVLLSPTIPFFGWLKWARVSAVSALVLKAFNASVMFSIKCCGITKLEYNRPSNPEPQTTPQTEPHTE